MWFAAITSVFFYCLLFMQIDKTFLQLKLNPQEVNKQPRYTSKDMNKHTPEKLKQKQNGTTYLETHPKKFNRNETQNKLTECMQDWECSGGRNISIIFYVNEFNFGGIFRLLLFIYLFGILRRFQHCTGHITTGSWKGRGNQYIEFIRVLYCKLPTNGKQLPAFPLEAVLGIEPRPQRWEARVLPLCHRGPQVALNTAQVISRRVILWAEKTSTYSWSRFCTVHCQRLLSNYQLSHIRDLGLKIKMKITHLFQNLFSVTVQRQFSFENFV